MSLPGAVCVGIDISKKMLDDRIDAEILTQMADVIDRHPSKGWYILSLPYADRELLVALIQV
ncbi:hypothetical protein FGS43_23140 [Salmonella enterica]|uniref:Uncharacterized protein n=1 Tax=Salmonella oranienberg TaxID=28147 RepID=A0A730ENQ6_SALON|nr:hypothetical protein [Salmonella enterica]ECC3903287.1 hypothetical protein [Salmonella enterica subsp. enterica]ECR6166123.1 hypothetical protein [Salmonella enterica subsp. enterica serovar Muenchen]ECW9664595.1 hypothetical protein [Salmonella enterica subsp. enterica serovar Poona]EDF6154861.1 hypothetical protein [Salmonella enterica subsp. enterica serovar Give]EDU0641613.1 hypothetical protein [Salmonella enterica subsp. enterica serovar Urbana]EEB7850128.1 hypothetical protein [Sal